MSHDPLLPGSRIQIKIMVKAKNVFCKLINLSNRAMPLFLTTVSRSLILAAFFWVHYSLSITISKCIHRTDHNIPDVGLTNIQKTLK